MNSTPSNGALVLLALLYGEGDFYKTLQYAMALGYDADCNAATAGRGPGHAAGIPPHRRAAAVQDAGPLREQDPPVAAGRVQGVRAGGDPDARL